MRSTPSSRPATSGGAGSCFRAISPTSSCSTAIRSPARRRSSPTCRLSRRWWAAAGATTRHRGTSERPLMRIAELNWMQVEEYLERDDRVVLPIGSTEQHGYLSLATDVILAERVSVEAAEPLGVPVMPVLPFGVAPGFTAYPGTVSVRLETLVQVLSEALDGLHGQ